MKQTRNTKAWPHCTCCGLEAMSGDVMVESGEGLVCRVCFVEELEELDTRELARAFGREVRLI